MARNQEPMTDEELEAAKDDIADLFDEVRADLEAEKEAVADGGSDSE